MRYLSLGYYERDDLAVVVDHLRESNRVTCVGWGDPVPFLWLRLTFSHTGWPAERKNPYRQDMCAKSPRTMRLLTPDMHHCMYDFKVSADR